MPNIKDTPEVLKRLGVHPYDDREAIDWYAQVKGRPKAGLPRAVIDSAEEFEEAISELEKGHRRTSVIKQTGIKAIAFFTKLRDDQYAKLARELYRASSHPLLSIGGRMAAIQSVLKVMQKIVKLHKKLTRASRTELIDHCRNLMYAFFSELSSSEFAEMADTMVEMAMEKSDDGAPHVRNMASALNAVVIALEMAIDLDELKEEEDYILASSDTEVMFKAAERDIKQIRADMKRAQKANEENPVNTRINEGYHNPDKPSAKWEHRKKLRQKPQAKAKARERTRKYRERKAAREAAAKCD